MFDWFGNNAVYERSGYSTTSHVGNKTFTGSGETPLAKTGSTSFMKDGASQALSLAQAGANIMSYNSMYKQSKQNEKIAKLNMLAVMENYKINNLRLEQNAFKTLGAIQNRAGTTGSALDLLQESAFNVALDSWQLKRQYEYDLMNAHQQYKQAKKAKKSAQYGKIGSAIATTAAVVAAPFTGGTSLMFAGPASQIGGQTFSSFA